MHYISLWEMIDRKMTERIQVRPELRGYKMHSVPPDRQSLSVSLLAKTICSTHRDIYFEKVLHERGRQERPWKAEAGTIIHNLLQAIHEYAERYLLSHQGDFSAQKMHRQLTRFGTKTRNRLMNPYKDDRRFGQGIWNELDQHLGNIVFFESLLTCSLLVFKASLKTNLATGQGVSLAEEFRQVFNFSAIEHRVSAPQLGLSDPVTPDFLYGGHVIGDIKTGAIHEDTFEMTCVGYALAYEAEYKRDIDYGVILHVGWEPRFQYPVYQGSKVYSIDDSARSRFTLLRDQKLDVLVNRVDPGVQQDEPRCQPCAFYQKCWGNGADD